MSETLEQGMKRLKLRKVGTVETHITKDDVEICLTEPEAYELFLSLQETFSDAKGRCPTCPALGASDRPPTESKP